MLRFAGSSFGEPETVAQLQDVARVTQRLARSKWRIPPDRRWLLGQPLRQRITAIGVAALSAQECMRALQGVKLANAAWDQTMSGVAMEDPVALAAVSDMPLEEFTARCDQAFRLLATATAEGMAATSWLAAETFALLHLIGFAIHGPTWFPNLVSPPGAEMKTTEAAALLRCTPRHVQRLAKEGRISARRHPDGMWRYRTTSLCDYRDLGVEAES